MKIIQYKLVGTFLVLILFHHMTITNAAANLCPISESKLLDLANRARVMASTAEASISDSAEYRQYFGQPSAAGMTRLKEIYGAISSHLLIGTVSFKCGSDAPKCLPGRTAYVDPNVPYNIHLCDAFFTMPQHSDIPVPPAVVDDTWGGQEGTIIHEMSHFENVGSTDDRHNGKPIYGRSKCESLAQTSAESTLNIADCVQYYAESVTSPLVLP